MTTRSTAWQDLSRNDLGFLNTLSHIFARLETRQPNALLALRTAECLFVGSDYGGEHSGAVYHTISFLMADIAECAAWQSTRERIRIDRLLGHRRMAFKNMNDSVRTRALHDFLESTNMIRGMLIVFAIHKHSGSLFGSGDKLDPTTQMFCGLQTMTQSPQTHFV
jgi:hypothetical protein